MKHIYVVVLDYSAAAVYKYETDVDWDSSSSEVLAEWLRDEHGHNEDESYFMWSTSPIPVIE